MSYFTALRFIQVIILGCTLVGAQNKEKSTLLWEAGNFIEGEESSITCSVEIEGRNATLELSLVKDGIPITLKSQVFYENSGNGTWETSAVHTFNPSRKMNTRPYQKFVCQARDMPEIKSKELDIKVIVYSSLTLAVPPMLRIGEENVVTCKYPNAFGLFKLDLFLESVPLNGSERTTKNPDLTLSVELTTKLVAVPDHNGQNITCSVSHQPNFDQAVSGTLYVEYAPVVSTPQLLIKAFVNDGVVVPCEVKANPIGTSGWTKNNASLVLDHYRLKVGPSSSKHDLLIKSIVREDFGNYTCWAKNKHGETRSEQISVAVLETGKLVIDQFLYIYNEGQSVQFRYSFFSERDVSISEWYKDGALLMINESSRYSLSGHILNITNLTRSDAGIYYVILRDKYLAYHASSNITLVVYYRPIPLKSMTELMVRVESSVLLNCTTESLPPVLKFTWYHNNVTLSNTLETHRVTTWDVEEDFGIYICQATNLVGSANVTFNLVNYEADSKKPITNTSSALVVGLSIMAILIVLAIISAIWKIRLRRGHELRKVKSEELAQREPSISDKASIGSAPELDYKEPEANPNEEAQAFVPKQGKVK